MKDIVPAILTNNPKDMQEMLINCKDFTDYVQIDIMDGKFVASNSLSAQELSQIKVSINNEAHLMVEDPLSWVEVFKKLGTRRIIFHVEIKRDLAKIIDAIHANKLEAGIALNPGTRIEDIEYLINKIDAILFMSVNPGFYGAPFIPEVLTKIKKFKQAYPKIITGIDGGVKADNIKEISLTGVDFICIGSAILKAQSPKDAYRNFKKTVNE